MSCTNALAPLPFSFLGDGLDSLGGMEIELSWGPDPGHASLEPSYAFRVWGFGPLEEGHTKAGRDQHDPPGKSRRLNRGCIANHVNYTSNQIINTATSYEGPSEGRDLGV
jgi:hypothetical protein